MAANLTILTVVIEKHYRYIRRQLDLAAQLNPGVPFELHVIDNASPDGPGFSLDDRRCAVRPGAKADQSLSVDYRGSYHHAAALNAGVKDVRTRYLLVLDPDLFPVRRNWIGECIEHMSRRNLAIFGVPWHYRWYRKYRYFPCVHFMLIDLEKVDRDGLDFTPALKQDHEREGSWGHDLFRRAAPILYLRYLIGTRRDTGWRIHHLHGRAHDHGQALPVIELARQIVKPKLLATAEGQQRERTRPRRWSFLPTVEDYLEPGQAPGFEHYLFKALEPETFAWRGAPFAFHLRRNVRDVMNGEQGRDIEAEALEDLFARIEHAPSWTDWSAAEARS